MERYIGDGLKLPLWSMMEAANVIFISGCGGGFDVLQGLPLYFKLKGMGKTVYLGNLTSSNIKTTDAPVLVSASDLAQSPVLFEVTADSNLTKSATPANAYFPEKYLCEWFRSIGTELAVYTFMKRGITSLTTAYRYLLSRFNIDLIILLDGGNDSLMAGDEHQLGTPAEEMMTMFAVHSLDCKAVLVCLGLGADRFHGVSDCSTFRAVAELTAGDGFLGAFSLVKSMPEVQGYLDASTYVQTRMPTSLNYVHYYVSSALDGHFGAFSPPSSEHSLFTTPLMCHYFSFSLPSVIRRVKYRELVEDTKTQVDLMLGIEYYRNNFPIRDCEEIPRTNEF